MSTQATSMPNDLALAHLIAQVESNDDPYAIRLEPKTYLRLTNAQTGTPLLTIAKINRCSLPTARMIYSTSFGAWQVMGFNWYALGLNVPIGRIFGDKDLQAIFFFKYLTSHNINKSITDVMASDESINHFALMYNGSTQYADRMKQVYKELMP